MTLRSFLSVLVVLLALAGCNFVESSSWSGGSGGDIGSTNTGGDGGQAAYVCMSTLGYDPASVPVGPLVPSSADLAGITVSVLQPFAVDTTCETVVVGFFFGHAPCEMPSAVDIVTFDALDPEAPATPAVYVVAPVAGPFFFTSNPNAYEVRLAVHTVHPKGLTPFIGAVVRENFCPAVMPSCETNTAMRYRANPPWKGWHRLSDDLPDQEGTDGALYFGLADCAEG